MKNVVVVCDYAYVEGGAAKVAIQTAVALAKHTNMNVYYIAGCGKPCQDLRNSRIMILALEMPELLSNPNKIIASKNGIFNMKAYKAIKKFLDSLNAKETIIHVHTWTKVLSSAVFKAAHENGIPIFITAHDYFLACPNGGCFDYVKNEICERMPLSFKCLICNCDIRHYYHKVWRCMRQIKQNSVIRRFNDIRYIFISKLQKEQLLKRIPTPVYQYMLLNPITCEKRFRVKAEKQGLYVYIGRLSVEKGAGLFCEAVTAANVEAVVVGDGKMRKMLEDKYPNIHFTGWLEKREIQDWINKTRCLIFPALYYEGSPLTVPEVQAFGIPCIVTDCSSATDTIINGENGIITKANKDEIAKAISKMRSDEYVENMSKKTYTLFDEGRVSGKRYVDQLMVIYAEANI